MNFRRYKCFTVFIILMYFGSSAPFIPPPSEKEPNSNCVYPRMSLLGLSSPLEPVLGNKCAVLPSDSDSNFEILIKKKCYVDKTDYLYKMVNRTQNLWFLSRPRRFGKSLLIKTMESFFKGETKLFVDTKMYYIFMESLGNSSFKHPNVKLLKYPVIRLDFSEIKSDSFPRFYSSLLELLEDKAAAHNIHLSTQNIGTAIRRLIEKLNKKYNKKVVILIDEYDAPYTRIYAANKNEASRVLGTLQDFFSILKAEVDHIRFSITVGITRLALSDFFSGANAAVDLTMNPDYAGILGFTETELRQYFGGYIENVAKNKGNTIQNVLNEIKKWHHGFRFTLKNESLYNPISVIGYLRAGGELRSWSTTGGGSQIFVEILKQFPLDALKMLLKDEMNTEVDDLKKKCVVSAGKEALSGNYNFESSTDGTALVAFLYHSGYLSIRSYNETTDEFTLDFSNREIKIDFTNRLVYSFNGLQEKSSRDLVTSMEQDLDKHEWKPFILKLKVFFSQIPYQLMSNQRENVEAFFHLAMFLMFKLNTNPFVYRSQPSWEESTNMGRTDIVITIGDTKFIFEPKMHKNPVNPVYECKQKYFTPHLHLTEYVVCFGLKFRPNGVVDSWGEATVSKEGKLLRETGEIKLTYVFNDIEKQDIINQLKDFKKYYPIFTLQPENFIEFLKQVGPTMEDEQVFVEKFTEDKKTLCLLLKKIRKQLPKSKDNFKGILFSLVKRFTPKKDRSYLKNISNNKHKV